MTQAVPPVGNHRDILRQPLHGRVGLLALSMLASLALPVGVSADVFMRVDEAGVAHYTNTPDRDGYELIVAVLKESGSKNRAEAQPKGSMVAVYAPHVEAAAAEFQVDKALVHAVITAESGYNAAAVSRAGAQGLMQLMPATAKRYGVDDAFDPVLNIRAGTRYLRDLVNLFDNDLSLAVAAYNAGENAVIRHGRQIPPYRETQAYVPKVMALYRKYRASL